MITLVPEHLTTLAIRTAPPRVELRLCFAAVEECAPFILVVSELAIVVARLPSVYSASRTFFLPFLIVLSSVPKKLF